MQLMHSLVLAVPSEWSREKFVLLFQRYMHIYIYVQTGAPSTLTSHLIMQIRTCVYMYRYSEWKLKYTTMTRYQCQQFVATVKENKPESSPATPSSGKYGPPSSFTERYNKLHVQCTYISFMQVWLRLRQVGKARKSHIFGYYILYQRCVTHLWYNTKTIEHQAEQSESHPSQQLQQENSELRLQVKALEERANGLEENLAGQISNNLASIPGRLKIRIFNRRGFEAILITAVIHEDELWC